MSMVEDLAKEVAPNALIGIGVVLAIPIILPFVGTVARPLAKEAIKGYFLAQRKVKEMMAETSEQFSDLVAEVRAENAATMATAGGGVASGINREEEESTAPSIVKPEETFTEQRSSETPP